MDLAFEICKCHNINKDCFRFNTSILPFKIHLFYDCLTELVITKALNLFKWFGVGRQSQLNILWKESDLKIDLTKTIKEQKITFVNVWKGYSFLFMTNNSQRPPIEYREKCKKMGIYYIPKRLMLTQVLCHCFVPFFHESQQNCLCIKWGRTYK